MSNDELLRKFYIGSYKTSKLWPFWRRQVVLYFIYSYLDSHGFFACPLYNENKTESEQLCNFFVENEGESLNDDEFRIFWSHVQVVHEGEYNDILKNCRSKIRSNISHETQVRHLFSKICLKENCKEPMRTHCSLINSLFIVHWWDRSFAK